ncbi:MAG TPA: c-type cytochrome [Gaiellaceae bacterium]|nr:c-type cytochrome [Gaiellaceae bacterium]
MRLAVVVSAACVAVVTVALAGCGSGGFSSGGSQSAGKQLFLDAGCGACHTLADAGTAGTIGPNLDDAFAQAREDGLTSDTFTQVVAGQIRYPVEDPSTEQIGMPGVDQTLPRCVDVDDGSFCVDDQGQAVQDVAAYVGSVAGTGATPAPPGVGETDGRSIFLANCGACHVLADAGTAGTVGPNLDESQPSKELAVDRVTNGRGAMPAFEDSLSSEQIQAVAEYVSSNAGR